MADDDDFSAWEPQEPPADFAERVVERARKTVERPSTERRRSRRVGTVLVGAAALAAGLALFVRSGVHGASADGDRRADARTQIDMGRRAIAVLEPGAHVAWHGDDVTQDAGDVFYRVEPGGRFRVHTPAGDVEVLGTCFRVRVEAQMNKRDVMTGSVGAVMGALAFVGVYEGKVRVSRASDRVELAPGESALAGGDGVHASGSLADGQAELERRAAASDDPTGDANERLANDVRQYKDRLEKIEGEKKKLEVDLASAQQRLASTQSDGAAPRLKNEFDLGPDDWKQLAKEGGIKFAIPCARPGGWNVSADQLNELGLGPQDAATLKDVYAKSYQRTWNIIRPVCAKIVSPEIADKLGRDGCPHTVLDVSRATDKEATEAAITRVGEVRAGLRPMPNLDDPNLHPVEKVFLALTGEMKSFEADLAQHYGPEDAHRLAYDDAMCLGHSTWGGSRSAPSAKP